MGALRVWTGHEMRSGGQRWFKFCMWRVGTCESGYVCVCIAEVGCILVSQIRLGVHWDALGGMWAAG